MQISEVNSSVLDRRDNILPPIADRSGLHLKQNGICGNNSLPATMVSQNHRGTSSKSLIYRSIPPRPHTFTLSDMIGETLPQQKTLHNKKLGLTGSSSSEFAKRFLSRPTTQPKVVEFNVGKMGAQKRRRGINGFFPPVKLRTASSAKSTTQTATSTEVRRQHHLFISLYFYFFY